MITLETPLTAVVGDKATKRKRMAEGLGLHTVGDLLRHFPRRYVKAGELTRVADLHEGEMLTVIGEIARSELKTYSDRRTRRPAYRLETVLQTDGPRLKMTFFAKNQHTSQVAGEPSRGRTARRVRGPGQPVPQRLAAHQPEDDPVRDLELRRGRRHR